MIASESNQIAESAGGSGRVADHTNAIAAFTSRHSASHGRLGKKRTTGLDGFDEFLTLRRGRGTVHNAGVMMVSRSYARDCTSERHRRRSGDAIRRASAFLDLDTGQVETVSHALLREAEDFGDEEPDLPTWQKHEWEIAKRIVSTDRFQELPTKFEVHEWAIMQNFSRSVESDSIREDILNAIHGPGAFRNFKDTLRRHGIESSWFAFRTEALNQIALGWCEENQIVCE